MIIQLRCRASVEDTDYEYFAQDDFRVRKPDIKFVFTGKPTHDVAHDIHVRLENPLPIPMTKGVFQIEGSGIEEPLILKVDYKLFSNLMILKPSKIPQQVPDVPPKSFAETRFAYKPKYVGSAKLVAKFMAKEIDDVDGFRVFEIAPKPDDVLMSENNHDTIVSKVANEE